MTNEAIDLHGARRTVTDYIDRVINQRAVELLDEFIADDYVGHGFAESREALRSFMTWQRATAADWHIDVRDVVAEGDRVAVRAIAGGTRSESSPGVPYPTPQRMRLEWITIYRVAANRIAELWVVTRELPDETMP